MKGIVFTEFLDMVEKKFGYEMVDHIIENSDLESEGIYTAIGTYDHAEIIQLLMNLSGKTEIDPQLLLTEFGEYLFDTFLASYPQFFEAAGNTFEFLASIDSHIHVEVQKLYPEATLPRFESEVKDDKMIMIYRSERKMSSLAYGLITKSIKYYKEDLIIEKLLIKEDGSEVEFIIKADQVK